MALWSRISKIVQSLSGGGEDLSAEMRSKLPLPDDLKQLLDPAFDELKSKLEINELTDRSGKSVSHHRTPEVSGKVAVLHLPPRVLDYQERGREIIGQMADLFVKKFEVLYVFCDTQRLEMGTALARLWERDSSFKKAVFFGSYTINSIRELETDKRQKYIITELSLEQVLTIPGRSVLLDSEREEIVDIIATQADASPTSEKDFFRTLIRGMSVPDQSWKKVISDPWTGDALGDARRLVEWAEDKKVGDERFTGLICLLDALLNQFSNPRLRQIRNKYQGR